jgi:peptidoglycan/xylan/chitin deacetylase (PgdA/CDA1 family)
LESKTTTIVILLIAATLVFPSAALYKTANAAECNCVVFRLDDIQDYWLNSVQAYVMDVFINRNQKVTVGEVMNFFGSDPLVLNKTKQGGNAGLFEYAIHGWNHDDYTKFSLSKQQSELQKANGKMQALYGKKSNVFITPYNEFNANTLTAMKNLNIQIISAANYTGYYDNHPSTPWAPTADSNGR